MQKNKNTNQFFFKKANKNANIILYEIAVQPNASHHLIHRYIAIMTNKIAFADDTTSQEFFLYIYFGTS